MIGSLVKFLVIALTESTTNLAVRTLYKIKNSRTMWAEQNNALFKRFTFKDFSEAFAFMTRVALLAEKHDHHPNWNNSWNTVNISLNTHDAGNIVTEKDRQLASEIDKLVLA